MEFVGFDVRTRLNLLRSSAKSRGLNINLDIAKYQYLIDNGCEFCGIDLINEKGYCLDRVDNKKGYNIKNIVACCKVCNRAKNNMSVEDFFQWVNKISNHNRIQINIRNKLESLGINNQIYGNITLAITQAYSDKKNYGRIKEINKKS